VFSRRLEVWNRTAIPPGRWPCRVALGRVNRL